MFKLGNYLKKYKANIIIGPSFKFLETMTDIINPILVALMIDVGIANNDAKYIINLAIIMLIINVLGVIFAFICQRLSSLTSEGVGRDIRHDMYAHILTLSHAELDKYTTMSLTNRCIRDVDQVQSAISMTLRQIARIPFTLIVSTIISMIINLQISLIFFALLPILFLFVYIVMKKTLPLFTEARTNLDKVSNVTRENLSGNRVVRAFNKQDAEITRFKKVNTLLTSSNLKVGDIVALLQPFLYFFVNIAIILIIWVGGIKVNSGAIKVGNIVTLINYFILIATSLISLSRTFIAYTRTGASLKRIKEVFSVQNTIKEVSNPITLSENDSFDIEFKDVCFGYTKSKNVLTNINFTIPSGSTLGIIGGTGSGKSTIINLISRFYDVSSGEVLINGKNIKKYDISQLRKLISVVPQNPNLFRGTISENMRWRDKNATDAEITRALMIAQAYDFVKEYNDGINHKVERGGTNFSGGQRQRLTIARALVGKSKVLILDDSTSALDYATDAALRKALNKNFTNVTKIIVSQRANSLSTLDNILVLDKGEIVGQGTHTELLQNCNVYREIYNSQNKRKVGGGKNEQN